MLDSKVFKKYESYVNENAKKIIELEKQIEEIKGSEEWMAAMNYFRKMKYDRKIIEAPNKKNGYKIKYF